MPFCLCSKLSENGSECFERIHNVSLGGRQAIYRLWVRKGEPRNQGWHIAGDELVSEVKEERDSGKRYIIVIDLLPGAAERIELIEVLDIYAFTYCHLKTEEVWWTPLMLRLRDLYIEDFPSKLTAEEKSEKMRKFVRNQDGADVLEFLYLQGDEGKWNWGRVGSVNGALIREDARQYFGTFFCKASS